MSAIKPPPIETAVEPSPADRAAGRPPRVGYVVKRYPRYSETFVVTEILAHEAAGLAVEIFALGNPMESHFQDSIARVRAPVTYLAADGGGRASDFWAAVSAAADELPGLWAALSVAAGEPGREVYQAVLLARHARARGITHLHAHFATSAATVARLAARLAGLPFTFTAHAKDIYHEEVRPEDLRRKLADAAAVVTVSDYNARHLRATHGPAADRVVRVYNGMDLGRLPFAAPADRPPVILAVGRLVEKKGFADLIDACGLLAARGRLFRCRIVGSGDQEPQLRRRIGELGLDGRVELLGPRPQDEVFALVRSAAMLAAPCVVSDDGNRDGLPTVLLEAMALGTPCVATDVTGIPEAIRHGQTGLIVPQHDPATLAGALDRLLTDPALRVDLAAAARRLIEAEFDARRTAAQLRAIFASASEKVPAASPPDDGTGVATGAGRRCGT